MTATIDSTTNDTPANDTVGDSSRPQTTVQINSLITGRRIEHPVYDTKGVLLLAAGCVVTEQVKQAIRQRGERKIRIAQTDADRVIISANSVQDVKTTIAFDNELTQKLDAIMDSGLLGVKNKGPAVKNDVVFLGRKGYCQDQRNHLIDQHEKNGRALGQMMSEALNGESMDGSIVATMAAAYLKEMATDTDNVLCSTINQFEDDDLAARSLEVALLAMAIGIEMDFDAENIRNLAIAGLVHDWGMMRVPAEIRQAKRKLNTIEMLEIKKHPIHSLELLQRVSALPRIVSVIAYQVHERFNGTGYPRGRQGNSIHPFARILQVADSFVSMTSPRSYRPPMMRYAAMECLIRQAKERAVDAEAVRALLKIQSLFPIGSYVTLSDGSIAHVVRRNQDHYTSPIVQRIQDAAGNCVDLEDDINLIDLHADAELSVQQALPTPGSDELAFNEDLYQSSLTTIV